MEQQDNYNIKEKKWKQISYGIRQKVEALYTAHHKASEIAKQLNYSKRTIERELLQGKVQLLDTEYRFYNS